MSSVSCSIKKILLFSLTLLACAGSAPAEARQQSATGPAMPGLRLAVFPIDNLSSASAPLREMRLSMMRKLLDLGVEVINDESLAKVMERHRIRYTGGIDIKTAQALKNEAGVDAVLITSLELYLPDNLPKIALTARLVATGPLPEIIWMESIGLAGDDAPGLLGLGLISDPQKLQERALRYLAGSLAGHLHDRGKNHPAGMAAKTFRPKQFYASEDIAKLRKGRVAVIPFFNESSRTRAGEILLLHFLNQLVGMEIETMKVVEPGVVREKMLNQRIIMNRGVSYRDLDLIGIPLEVDFFFTGKVFAYQDYPGAQGAPLVDFSTMGIGVENKRIVWASASYNAGDDAVFFFDVGRLSTASAMAEAMMRSVVIRMFGEK
jgi:hypothetical protein